MTKASTRIGEPNRAAPPDAESKKEEISLRKKELFWKRIEVVSTIVLTISALGFTVLFNYLQQMNAAATNRLAESNLEIADAQKKIAEEQLKNALIPSLVSQNAKQKEMALFLANALDEQFAIKVAGVLSMSDPDSNVRESARSTLGALSQSTEDEIQRKAVKSISDYDLANEMREKGLLTLLDDAQNLMRAGNSNDRENALQLFRQIVKTLSADGRNRLDQKLLSEAESNYKDGYDGDALLKYQSLFSTYYKAYKSE